MYLPWVLSIGALIILPLAFAQITSVQLITHSTPNNMYSNREYSQNFVSSGASFNCAYDTIFTYNQSSQDLQDNTPYQLSLQGVSQNVKISISTRYGVIQPTLSQYSCVSSAMVPCTITILNNCVNPVSFLKYFDTITLNIQTLQPFTYNVLCNSSSITSTFQAGQFIITISSVIIIIITAIYSQAWTFQGKGIQITYLYIFLYTMSLAIGGTLMIVTPSTAQIIGDVIIWFIGTFAIVVCANQLIHKLGIQCLMKTLINIKRHGIRIIDLISFFIAIALLLSWMLSGKNWIINDVISVCVIVATIKIFKITSFKKAIILYLVSLTIQIIFVILIDVLENTSYEDFLLNEFNNPLQMQLPTINPVFGLKCSWVPVSVMIFPGMLISYFRRFDNSRNTNIYLITSSISFFVGALIWITINVISPVQLPFQLIAGPAALGLAFLFAYNRKQIKILWNGKFYDPEFMNKHQEQENDYTYEMEAYKVNLEQSFFDELKIGNNYDSEICYTDKYCRNFQLDKQISPRKQPKDSI